MVDVVLERTKAIDDERTRERISEGRRAAERAVTAENDPRVCSLHQDHSKAILGLYDMDERSHATQMDMLQTLRIVAENGDKNSVTIRGVKVPIRYIVALVIVGMFLITLVVIEAIRHDQLEELANAYRISKGEAAKRGRITVAHDNNERRTP